MRERERQRGQERSCANTRLLKKESNTLGAEKEKSGFRLRSFQLAWHGKGGLVARLLVRSMSSLSFSLFHRCLSRRFPLSSPFIPTSYSISLPPSPRPPFAVTSLAASFILPTIRVLHRAHETWCAARESRCHLCKRPFLSRSSNLNEIHHRSRTNVQRIIIFVSRNSEGGNRVRRDNGI